MKVESVSAYRRPKYPCLGERIQPFNASLSRSKSATLIAAILAASGALAGCEDPPITAIAGDIVAPRYLSEQEILQILQYEAEALGITFDDQQDTVIRYAELDVALDLYNEEKQFGVAVVEEEQRRELYEALYNADEQDVIEGLYAGGIAAKGSLEDAEQPVDFFLTADISEYNEDTLRQSFREYIEWLQAEGVI